MDKSTDIELWCRLLFDDMERLFLEAKSKGLRIDPEVLGVAHVLHGLETLKHLTDCSPNGTAMWLRLMAEDLEHGFPLHLMMTIYRNPNGKSH